MVYQRSTVARLSGLQHEKAHPETKVSPGGLDTRGQLPGVLEDNREATSRGFLSFRERYYPRLMAVVATTLRIEDNLDGNGNGEFYMVFKLAGVKYALDLDELTSIWGLRNNGVLCKGGRNPPKYMGRLYHERAIETLQLFGLPGGKAGNHGTVSEEDLIILLVMVEEVRLNWPFLLAYQLYYYSIRQVESGLEHGMLWTKVFEYLGIPVGENNAITQRQLNQMRRNLNIAGAGDVADEAGDEDIPQQPVVGSAQQFPPELMEPFSQGIQPFRSAWGENSLNLGRQLDGLETQFTRHGEKIHGLREEIRGWFDQFPRSGGQGSRGDAPSQG
ncbi:hypothetical protein PIB30_058288 [Stylosanthes scabra]|uniref:Uncharacterized protein n=1 Tax=Stylosanthes scabra TaxID=79078 RepID=A0ABU6YLR8_9FABA|nr:hypothetical protein [Stylosanthes scabra]